METVEVVVKDPTKRIGSSGLTLSVSRALDVAGLKERLQAEWPGSPLPSSQRLIHAGKQLKGDEGVGALTDAGGCVFHLVVAPSAEAQKPPASSAPPQTSSTQHQPPSSAQATSGARTAGTSSSNSEASSSGRLPTGRQPQPEPPNPAPSQPIDPFSPPQGAYGAAYPPFQTPYPTAPYAGDPGWAQPPPYWVYMPPDVGAPPQGYYPYMPYPAPPMDEDGYIDPNFVYPPMQGMIPPPPPPPAGDHHLHHQHHAHPPSPTGQQNPPGRNDVPVAEGARPVVHQQAPEMQGIRQRRVHFQVQRFVRDPARQGAPVEMQGVRVREFNFQFEVNWMLILRLGFLVFLLHVEGDNVRLTGLIIGAVLVYLQQMGKLDFLRNYVRMIAPNAAALVPQPWARRPRNQDDGEGQADTNADNPGDDTGPIAPVGIAMNVYSFVYGLVCSLWPSWKPEEAFRPPRPPAADRPEAGGARGAAN